MVKFEGYEFVDGGVCAAEGFTAAGVIAGIKAGNTTKRDLAMIFCAERCKAAALYTTNKVKGAPIYVSKKHLEDGCAQAVIVNSGNANTCNENGIEIAEQMCELTAEALDIDADDVLVGSTGVIGQPLSIKPIKARIPTLAKELSSKKSSEACEAIMTTDTRKKEIAVEFEIEGRKCHVGGISKGSGMIAPNMATMLGFITTDVAICHELLEKALRKVNSLTYSMVSVDGDTSTNDSFVVIATGKAKMEPITSADDPRIDAVTEALCVVARHLAQSMIRDGEGATKFITVQVQGAKSEAEALQVCYAVAHSPLVKTAFFASDPNLGRILAAVGNSRVEDLDSSKVTLWLDDVLVAEHGGRAAGYREKDGVRVMAQPEITVRIDLGRGVASETVWTTDLSHEYVTINADYRS